MCLAWKLIQCESENKAEPEKFAVTLQGRTAHHTAISPRSICTLASVCLSANSSLYASIHIFLAQLLHLVLRSELVITDADESWLLGLYLISPLISLCLTLNLIYLQHLCSAVTNCADVLGLSSNTSLSR